MFVLKQGDKSPIQKEIGEGHRCDKPDHVAYNPLELAEWEGCGRIWSLNLEAR